MYDEADRFLLSEPEVCLPRLPDSVSHSRLMPQDERRSRGQEAQSREDEDGEGGRGKEAEREKRTRNGEREEDKE